MAFGFGFNKQKALSAAEKYVQQGKIQNAIAEYEKVLKADPKDLTVTNTVGDLYSRLGEVDKATECFKTVGDAYATQGFTVKAIAMYKKISKLKPSLESVLKLAELYTQQGLFNDARAQYLQVAEEFLKSGELENAVRIFQKILEMDPENTTMRVRLAEVYVRLGKKTEAWQIFSAAAETLRSKGSLTGAQEVLQRMLTLDPGNSYALLMQGRNLLESGDTDAAIEALQKVPDLDSNPDGLRDLLKAYLKTGRLSDAGTLATKLQSVHNDLSAISTFADALMQAGQYENALQVYDQHSDRLLAEDSDKVLKNLHSVIGHVRENPASLEKLLDLFQKAGDTTHITEVLELLAHASVHSGDLPRARDLYQKLATLEPGNPLHMANYQQVVSQLGGVSASTLISADEAAVIVDELEATAPSVHQHYSDAVALAVRSALTDAELFISYNMPAKALGPLMAALPQAPSDLRLNQRLAALHTRASRFAEAGVCCRTLQGVYSEAGYPEEATRYGELADRYEERSAAPAVDDSALIESADSAHEPAVEIPGHHAEAWPAAEHTNDAEFAIVADPGSDQDHDASDQAEAAPVAESQAAPAEIDLSSEWDDSVTIELDTPTGEAPEVEVADIVEATDIPAAAIEEETQGAADDSEKTAETIEEIRFYLEHGMPEQASAALKKLRTLTRDQAMLTAIEAEVEAASHVSAVSGEEAPAVEPVADVSEFAIEEPAAEFAFEEPAAEFTVEQPAAEFAVEDAPHPADEPAVASQEVESEPEAAIAAPPAPVAKKPAPVAPPVSKPVVSKPAASEPADAAVPGVLQEFVSDLESSLGENFLPGAVPHEASPVAAHASTEISEAESNRPELEPIGNAAPTSFGVQQAEVMGEFVADLEASLGDDFLKGAPVAEPEPAAEVQAAPYAATQIETPAAASVPPPVPARAPVAPLSAPAAASAAAASASSGSPISSQQVSALAQAPAPVAPKTYIPPAIPSAPAAKSSPFTEDAGVDLAEMFGELKQDLESGAATTEEDPETHYNLGIAFREMGLLDEAIGELQKTCQAVDRGHPFPQVMQTYTWLAQCFLDKGVPQAAIRWYDKALTAPGVDEETRTALHYELASAYETAGDRPAALKHFMEVYGRNIDYRDVAERIKPLKS
jgi:tetratricopeptide (TPR) repeat protein